MATTTPAGNGPNKTAWDEKELGCMWRREKASTGEKYLTGVLNFKNIGFDKDVQIVVFSNKKKTKDTHPDFRIYVSEKKPAAATAPAAKTTRAAAPAPAPIPYANELI